MDMEELLAEVERRHDIRRNEDRQEFCKFQDEMKLTAATHVTKEWFFWVMGIACTLTIMAIGNNYNVIKEHISSDNEEFSNIRKESAANQVTYTEIKMKLAEIVARQEEMKLLIKNVK